MLNLLVLLIMQQIQYHINNHMFLYLTQILKEANEFGFANQPNTSFSNTNPAPQSASLPPPNPAPRPSPVPSIGGMTPNIQTNSPGFTRTI